MKFIKFASIQIKPSDVVLDAGSSSTNAGMGWAHSEFNCEKIAKYILELMETGNYKAPWTV